MGRPTLLILAAGMGSRYGGFKQVDPVGPNGQIVLDYSLYDAWRAGFGAAVFIVQESLEEEFRRHFAKAEAAGLDIRYVHQRLADLPEGHTMPEGRQKPWGTGHAIWAARDAIGEPFAVINADDFYGRQSYQILSDFLTPGPAPAGTVPHYCMVAFTLRNTLSEHGSVSRGICSVSPDRLLTAVVECTKIEAAADGGARSADASGQWQQFDGDELASMNMWGFTPGLFADLEVRFVEFLTERQTDLRAEFFIPSVVDDLIKNGGCRTTVLHTPEKWFGMTYREDREIVTARIAKLTQEGVYPEALWD